MEEASPSQNGNGEGLPITSDSEGEHFEEMHLQFLHSRPVVAYPDEPLRSVVYRMAETGYTRFTVVERDDPQQLVGMVSLNDLLKARVHNLEEERHRERVIHLRLLFPTRNEIKSK